MIQITNHILYITEYTTTTTKDQLVTISNFLVFSLRLRVKGTVSPTNISEFKQDPMRTKIYSQNSESKNVIKKIENKDFPAWFCIVIYDFELG